MKLSSPMVKKNPKNIYFFKIFFVCFFLTKEISVGNCLQKLFTPFTSNIKNIPSVHQSSTLYLKLSLIRLPSLQPTFVRRQFPLNNILSNITETCLVDPWICFTRVCGSTESRSIPNNKISYQILEMGLWIIKETTLQMCCRF